MGRKQPRSPANPGTRSPRYRADLAALLLLSCLAVPCSSAQTSSPPGRAAIIQALQAGNNRAALSLAQTALQHTPHDCSLLSLEAIAFTGLQQTQEALGAFQAALTNCPAYLPALEGAAQIRLAQHSPEVVPLLERILVLQPANPTANAMLATTFHDQARCSEALRHYQASRALFASRPDLAQGYGACLVDTGDLGSALAVYKDLLAAKPGDAIRYDVALLQSKTRENAAALATLAPLLTGTQQVPALALASRIHEQEGETPVAVDLLRQAILQEPDQEDNYLDFATIAFTHKSFQVGIDMLDAGLQRLPQSASLFVARGVLKVQISQSDAAIADFETAHRLDPKLSFATDAVGILQSQQHENAESLKLFQDQARLHPNDPLLQYLLAEQLSMGGADEIRLNDAIAAAKRAVHLDPGYQAARDLLAVLYVRSNQMKLAVAEAEAALALDPDDQSALYQDILARRRLGETTEVIALTAKLNEARKSAQLRQQKVDRYGLRD